jgi:hypothetical protein
MTSINTHLPATNYEQPSRSDVETLLKIVVAAHPEYAGQVTADELNRSLWSVGHMWRLPQPSASRAFSFFVDEGSALLNTRGWPGVSGAAFLCGVWAHGDIPWRAARPKLGEVLEIALDSFGGERSGGRPCRTPNAWRAIAAGHANLLSPTSPRMGRVELAAAGQQITFRKQMPDGSYRRLGDNEPLWSK